MTADCTRASLNAKTSRKVHRLIKLWKTGFCAPRVICIPWVFKRLIRALALFALPETKVRKHPSHPSISIGGRGGNASSSSSTTVLSLLSIAEFYSLTDYTDTFYNN